MKSAYPASYNQVAEALESLCVAESSIGIFQVWYTAEQVAERAGVSVSTARKRLDELSKCRHYTRSGRRFGHKIGYRFEVLMASLDKK